MPQSCCYHNWGISTNFCWVPPWFFLKKYFFIRNLGMVSNSFVCIMSFGLVVKFWNWHRMLICLFTFLFFVWSKRRTNCSASFLMKSPNLFFILKGPQNTFHNNVKKHDNENLSIFNNNFNIHHPVRLAWYTPLKMRLIVVKCTLL